MSGDVQKITRQLRAPRGSDPGKVEIGYYMVVEGAVVMTDEVGKPLSSEKHHIDPGVDPKLIAIKQLRKRQSSSSAHGFGGKLSYEKLRY